MSWRNEGDSGRFAVYYWCEALDDLDVRNDEDPVTLSHEHVDYAWLSPESATERLSDVQERAVDVATEVYEP